jgi:hypothetical protein
MAELPAVCPARHQVHADTVAAGRSLDRAGVVAGSAASGIHIQVIAEAIAGCIVTGTRWLADTVVAAFLRPAGMSAHPAVPAVIREIGT